MWLDRKFLFFTVSIDYTPQWKLYSVYVDMEKALKGGYLHLEDGETLPADRIGWLDLNGGVWRIKPQIKDHGDGRREFGVTEQPGYVKCDDAILAVFSRWFNGQLKRGVEQENE